MKKNGFFWSMLAILMVTMLSVGFVACGSDDDDSSNPNSVVGTWVGHGTGGDSDDFITVTFNSNNTGVIVAQAMGSYGLETISSNFTYVMEGLDRGKLVASGDTFYFIFAGNQMTIADNSYDGKPEFILTKQ